MHSWEYMDSENIKKYAQIYKNLNFRIARLYVTNISNNKMLTFIENSGICLAVSTENLNEKLKSLCNYDSSIAQNLKILFKKKEKNITENIISFLRKIKIGVNK